MTCPGHTTDQNIYSEATKRQQLRLSDAWPQAHQVASHPEQPECSRSLYATACGHMILVQGC